MLEKKKSIINYFLDHDILIGSDLMQVLEDGGNIDKISLLIQKDLSIDVVNNYINNLKKGTAIEDPNKEPPSESLPKQISECGSESILDSLSEQHPGQRSEPTPGHTPEPPSVLPLSAPHKSTVELNIGPISGPPYESREAARLKYSGLEVIKSYDSPSHKREVEHFVSYFSSRYKQLEFFLKQRKELSNILSIARLKAKKDRENVSIIGLIRKKDITKNSNIILTIEDLTGEIKVLVNKTNIELLKLAQDLVTDEVIGVIGMNGDNILFSNQIIQPDIPLGREFKKYDKDEHVIFLSDLHFGSKYFLKEEFNKFITWIRQESGTPKQKEMASKVKYIFIVGDVVDGVGIYPNQESELDMLDIYDQYTAAAEQLSRIPKDITLIICPGNHDAQRLSEPQPKLNKKYAKPLYNMENTILLSNPSYVNICSTDTFSGFDILLYHGYSFDYYVANVDSIRLGGGYDRADLIMEFLLKRRHLAPAYKSTLIIPEIDHDHLVIDKVPDFFVTGHIHKTAVNTYKNVTLICGSCWQSKTSFQEKVGHNPEPARVPVVNLKTRKITLLNFEA